MSQILMVESFSFEIIKEISSTKCFILFFRSLDLNEFLLVKSWCLFIYLSLFFIQNAQKNTRRSFLSVLFEASYNTIHNLEQRIYVCKVKKMREVILLISYFASFWPLDIILTILTFLYNFFSSNTYFNYYIYGH